MCFRGVRCNSIAFCKWLLVDQFYCVLQMTVGRSHWNCCIIDAIWMLGFARNIVFFRINGVSAVEKSWLPLHDGCGHRRFAADSCSICVRNVTEGSRWLFLFFVDAVLLCFACVETLCLLELLHQSDVFYGTVLQFHCVLRRSVCRSKLMQNTTGQHQQRTEKVTWNLQLHCARKLNRNRRQSNDARTRRAREPTLLRVETLCVLELLHQSDVFYSSVLQHSIVFCNSLSADRSRMAASRFLAAAAAGAILLCFAAETRKSHCNSCMTMRMVLWQQLFPILVLMIFLLESLVKSASKSLFFPLRRRDPALELQIAAICVALVCNSTMSCTTQCLQIVVKLLRQVPCWCSCRGNTFVFCNWDS